MNKHNILSSESSCEIIKSTKAQVEEKPLSMSAPNILENNDIDWMNLASSLKWNSDIREDDLYSK